MPFSRRAAGTTGEAEGGSGRRHENLRPFADLVAGEPGDGAPTLFSRRRAAAFPKPASASPFRVGHRRGTSGWMDGADAVRGHGNFFLGWQNQLGCSSRSPEANPVCDGEALSPAVFAARSSRLAVTPPPNCAQTAGEGLYSGHFCFPSFFERTPHAQHPPATMPPASAPDPASTNTRCAVLQTLGTRHGRRAPAAVVQEGRFT
jgi:hypothetical protein